MQTKNTDLFGNDSSKSLSLADKYLLAPTSVLNTRDSNWQKLKKKWFKLGIKSEIGRNSTTGHTKDMTELSKRGFKSSSWSDSSNQTGNSIFDPVICEIIYKWFCPKNGMILDPFAGGSVRGIVANYLGYKYTGIELRQEQVESNREQAFDILPIENQPQYYIGDSEQISIELVHKYDLIFSCPPYMNLEKYSDLEHDLSNMNDNDFIIKYESIIKNSCLKLKIGCYAAFVVGDVRDNKGFYKDFTGITKQAFTKCGMKLYNELIIVNPVGSKAMTMELGFKSGKLGKVHQNIYIFKKIN
jgi:DNA modification methylase